ncbi:deoxyribose-phosphate aldolase [Gulosibacter sp. 10]|uniref:deoxyribose-phosphate aldolase n=1 Tax=Gulosibacter sp. 10 TaxID=1255570 RepID=UPI00097EE9AC|nr:deoxyribose-phosphate aldolase [Gulosibacter sp. 10]SJM67862.1 Deoxyribose-phosphate aldolase [Gulosibacter sp. 10]
MSLKLTRAELAKYIDHTLLATDATNDDVRALYAEAAEMGAYAVCVSPNMLPVGAAWTGLDPDAEPAEIPEGAPQVATVVGFPSGKHHSSIKATEAARAVTDGATEIDMVIDIGQLKAGQPELVEQDIRAVRRAAPAPTVLKVIIESAALTDEEIVQACEASAAAGADFVKTSTGFHKAGGATVEAVALMRRTVGDALGVKASGGVRTYADAMAMIEAGATRLGMSSGKQVLEEAPEA